MAPSRRWWPYDSPFEVAVSAVLTQRTQWANAARAVENLRAAGLLSPARLAAAKRTRVEACVRPAGFYRQKARALQDMARRLVRQFAGRFEGLSALDTPALRRELLGWRGVGEETADAILLYAMGRPAFVVDAYTARLMERFGVTPRGARLTYGQRAQAWTAAGFARPATAAMLHGAIVEFSKSTCAAVPACARCPIREPCAKAGVAIPRQRPPQPRSLKRRETRRWPPG